MNPNFSPGLADVNHWRFCWPQYLAFKFGKRFNDCRVGVPIVTPSALIGMAASLVLTPVCYAIFVRPSAQRLASTPINPSPSVAQPADRYAQHYNEH